MRPASAGATAAAGEDGLWAQLGRTWKKRESVELVNVVEELHDLLSQGVISGGQLAELAQRSELVAPTLAGCAKERKAHEAQARARRQPEEAAAAAAAASPETRAAICLQRHLRGWQAREHFAWLHLEQARKQREEARRLAREKKLQLEARARAQLADVQARWAETHASEDLDAVGRWWRGRRGSSSVLSRWPCYWPGKRPSGKRRLRPRRPRWRAPQPSFRRTRGGGQRGPERDDFASCQYCRRMLGGDSLSSR
jgi:hypothetical protein